MHFHTANHTGQSHWPIASIIHQKLFRQEEAGEDVCSQVILIGDSSCARSLLEIKHQLRTYLFDWLFYTDLIVHIHNGDE